MYMNILNFTEFKKGHKINENQIETQAKVKTDHIYIYICFE